MAPRALPPTQKGASGPGSTATAYQWPGDGAGPRAGPRRDSISGPSRKQASARGDRLRQDCPGQTPAPRKEADRGASADRAR
eukprot:13532607-Alexandrium_andersonii.AAC.1